MKDNLNEIKKNIESTKEELRKDIEENGKKMEEEMWKRLEAVSYTHLKITEEGRKKNN